MLKQLLQINDAVEYLPLTGMLDGKFFHTVPVSCGVSFKYFLVFEDGTYLEVKDPEKKSKLSGSYVVMNGRKLLFRIQEPLWYQSNLVSGVSPNAIQYVLDAKKFQPVDLFFKAKQYFLKYYDVQNEEELMIVLAHVIHTYLLGLLGKTFYLLLDGIHGSGKSTMQLVMSKLQYRGCFVGKSSIPAMIRKVHFLQASINLDEFEKMDPNEKKVVTGILNSGAYASGTKEIVNMDAKGGSNQIAVYNTFGAKTFSVNSSKFHSSLISRCIVINTVRNKRSVKSIYGLSYEDEQAFQELRDELFAYCLMNGKVIVSDIDKMRVMLESQDFYGRRMDIVSVVLGILSHFGADTKSVSSYLRQREEMDEEDSNENDRYFLVMEYLVELCNWQDGDMVEFSNKALVERLIEKLGGVEERFYPTPSSVGKLLKRNKIVLGKKDRKRVSGKGNYVYFIPKVRVGELVQRSGFKDLEIQFTPSQVQLVSEEISSVKDVVKGG